MTAINMEIENPVTSRELVELLPMHFEQKQAVMVWGDAGIGKSELSDQVALTLSRKKFDFRLNIREPVDMRGIPVPNMKTKTTDWFVPGELPKMDGSDGPSILVLDEINTGTMQMMAVAMQLVLDRKVGDYILPDNCVILAMGNRSKDSRAVVQMPKPLRNRFAHYTMVFDHESWVGHCVRTNLAPEIVAFGRFRPDHISRQLLGDENAYASPRSVYKCGVYVSMPTRLRYKAFVALVGKDVGSEMESFVAMYQSLANIEDILANPKTAKLPTERSECYAVVTALGRLADRKNFDNIVTYAKRIGETNRELEIVAVTDAVQRDKKLAETTAYVTWAVANQDITLH
jgi:hypothetical protein